LRRLLEPKIKGKAYFTEFDRLIVLA